MTLKQQAHEQLSMCCQYLCEKGPVIEYIAELESKLELLAEVEKHIETLELSECEQVALMDEVLEPFEKAVRMKSYDG